ncbi:MAG: DUF106 domain-containing protein [Nanoarchaeota archaeon]|nr:DUF106 domain-containing protein [Nanoarchaeota archaeon]MBU1135055.1 DUF106 domain-containing protein [Nanoarchaeota archaeon]MBU2520290.1 DUF106 domain-containing protein [Nanoarchaeota archaeon]
MAIEMLTILLVAAGISLLSALFHKFFVNQNDLKQMKNEMKYQKERANAAKKRGDKGVEAEASKEMMSLSGKQMKMTMKPLMYTMIVVIVILGWLSTTYAESVINLPIPMPTLSWAFPFVSLTTEYSWFFWYIIVSVPTTFAFRKLLGLEQ